MKILMVCLGNICRSPLAEALMRQKAAEKGLNWMVDSAGTNGYHTGEAPHPLSQKVAALHGLDISGQRARKFTAADFDRFDRIYAMAADVLQEMRRIAGPRYDASKASLLLDAAYPGSGADVEDPWYGPEKGYHEVFQTIESACEVILQQTIVHQP